MAKIINDGGIIKIIDDGGQEVVIEPSPFSPPMEMTTAEIDASMEGDWIRYSDTWDCSIAKTNGIVTINGLIKNGVVGSSNAMLLPEAYRPKHQVLTTQRTSKGTQRVDYYPNGYIIITSTGNRVETTDWVSINVSYKAVTP